MADGDSAAIGGMVPGENLLNVVSSGAKPDGHGALPLRLGRYTGADIFISGRLDCVGNLSVKEVMDVQMNRGKHKLTSVSWIDGVTHHHHHQPEETTIYNGFLA